MIFGFEKLLPHVSRFVTLKEGDFIFTGTPQGVSAVHPGDVLELFLDNEPVRQFEVK